MREIFIAFALMLTMFLTSCCTTDAVVVYKPYPAAPYYYGYHYTPRHHVYRPHPYVPRPPHHYNTPPKPKPHPQPVVPPKPTNVPKATVRQHANPNGSTVGHGGSMGGRRH